MNRPPPFEAATAIAFGIGALVAGAGGEWSALILVALTIASVAWTIHNYGTRPPAAGGDDGDAKHDG